MGGLTEHITFLRQKRPKAKLDIDEFVIINKFPAQIELNPLQESMKSKIAMSQ